VRLAAGNYAGSLFFLASTALLPLLVANQYGAAATAYFFVPWTLAVGLQLVALYMTTSLTVEVAFDESMLREYCERVLAQMFRLVAPATFVVVVAAPYILRVFGHGYAAQGTTLLRLLALATVPNVVVALGLSVARIQHSGRTVLWTQGALCVSTLGLSLALLPPLGIEGVGLAVLVSQTIVAAWLGLGMLRPILLDGRRAASIRRRGGTEE
jgi:O-antigen/teichoic acid export membrane protein